MSADTSADMEAGAGANTGESTGVTASGRMRMSKVAPGDGGRGRPERGDPAARGREMRGKSGRDDGAS